MTTVEIRDRELSKARIRTIIAVLLIAGILLIAIDSDLQRLSILRD